MADVGERQRLAGCDDLASAGTDVRRDENLRGLTTLGVGGPAAVVVRAREEADIVRALALAERSGRPVRVIGAGTNLLASDAGFDGVIIKLGRGFRGVQRNGHCVEIGAAATMSRLVDFCLREGLTGVEFAGQIPGTVGGAIAGNAGAYDGETADRLEAVWGVDIPTRQPVRLSREEITFAYRNSTLRNRVVITRARFALEPGEDAASREQIRVLRGHRTATQPMGVRTAGCVFKNPPGLSAGALLDRAQLKGQAVRDAAMSETHANFLINRGAAAEVDVRELIALARRVILHSYGIRLELELVEL